MLDNGVENLGLISPRFKYGSYNGIRCDSSWELAFVLYHLDHNIAIVRCNEYFTYKDNRGTNHLYFPDFVINGIYYEIKGWKSLKTEFKIRNFPEDKSL